MIHKTYTLNQAGIRVQVTFSVPNSIWADKIELAISGNDDFDMKPLLLSSTGDWTLTLDLPVDRVYRFLYLCDGDQWMNDTSADGSERNVRDGMIVCLLNTNITGTPPNIQALAKTPAPVQTPVMVGGRP